MDKPFLTVFSDSDPVTAGQEAALQQHIPGATGERHATNHGGHFLQGGAGPDVAMIIIGFARATPG